MSKATCTSDNFLACSERSSSQMSDKYLSPLFSPEYKSQWDEQVPDMWAGRNVALRTVTALCWLTYWKREGLFLCLLVCHSWAEPLRHMPTYKWEKQQAKLCWQKEQQEEKNMFPDPRQMLHTSWCEEQDPYLHLLSLSVLLDRRPDQIFLSIWYSGSFSKSSNIIWSSGMFFLITDIYCHEQMKYVLVASPCSTPSLFWPSILVWFHLPALQLQLYSALQISPGPLKTLFVRTVHR